VKYLKIYQFKIVLLDTKPVVWRRIQVPESFTFWDLHCAIQDSMGWLDYHLHCFVITDSKTGDRLEIGIPPDEDDDLGETETIAGWNEKIADWFTIDNSRAKYTYDFGDDWEHEVVLEAILPRSKDVKYPVCIDGKRACPPEDCGSYPGYEDICNGRHEFQEEYRDFDPELFVPGDVDFEDPKARLADRRVL